MDELKAFISKNSGISKARLQLYTLTNDPSENIDDYLFEDPKDVEKSYLSGYAQKVAATTQLIWRTSGYEGYKDLELRK
jgi:hypothetical protein